MEKEPTTDASAIEQALSSASTDTSHDAGAEPLSAYAQTLLKSAKWSAEEFSQLSPSEQQKHLTRLQEMDKHFQKGYAENADWKRQIEAVTAQFPGLTPDEVAEAVRAKRNGTPAPAPATATSATRGLDRLLAKATDGAQIAAIQELKQGVREEWEDLTTKERQAVNQRIKTLEDSLIGTRSQTIEREIDDLGKDYAPSLVEKYRSTMVQSARDTRFAKMTAEEMLFKLATPSEIKEAQLRAPKRQPAAEPAGTTRTGSAATTPSTEPSLDTFRDKRGRVNEEALWGAVAGKLPR